MAADRITASEAAQPLRLTRRQVFRLASAYRERGPMAQESELVVLGARPMRGPPPRRSRPDALTERSAELFLETTFLFPAGRPGHHALVQTIAWPRRQARALRTQTPDSSDQGEPYEGAPSPHDHNREFTSGEHRPAAWLQSDREYSLVGSEFPAHPVQEHGEAEPLEPVFG